MLIAIEPVLLAEKPDWVVVYGDTNSTLAGALAAAKLHIPIAHVEAGLRSFNRRMPEEVNRVLTDHVATLHLCPTRAAVESLDREGIRDGVHHVGDVMYDATLFAAEQAERSSNIIEELKVSRKNYAVATLHRPENTDSPERLQTAISYLQKQAERFPVVFPLHPRTRQYAERVGLGLKGLMVIIRSAISTWQGCCRGLVRSSRIPAACRRRLIFIACPASPCVARRSGSKRSPTAGTGLWNGPDFTARREIDEYGDGRAAVRIAQLLKNRRDRTYWQPDARPRRLRAIYRSAVVFQRLARCLRCCASVRRRSVQYRRPLMLGHRLPHLLREVDAIVLLHSTNGDTTIYLQPHVEALARRNVPLLTFVGNEINLPGSPIADKRRLFAILKPEFIATQCFSKQASICLMMLPSGKWLRFRMPLIPSAYQPTRARERPSA